MGMCKKRENMRTMSLKKKIEYILRCIKNVKDENFVNTVMEYRRGYHLISFQTNSRYDIDENLYHIRIGNGVDGFFSFFRETLDCLYYAEKCGFIPVVEFTQDMKYAEPNGVNGINNPFEYYFEQPGKYELNDLSRTSRVFQHERPHRNYAEEIGENSSYRISEEYINEIAQIAKKYIHLSTLVSDRIHNDLQSIFYEEEKILGVHYRGTDFKQGYKHHPQIVSLEDYITQIAALLKQSGYDGIFLATDDSEAQRRFEEVFQGKIRMHEAYRGDSQRSVMFSEVDRPHHHFELGYEVLRDVWTLAKCDGLVSGMSQVSICARIMNRSFDKKFEDEVVFDNGLNTGNKIYKG